MSCEGNSLREVTDNDGLDDELGLVGDGALRRVSGSADRDCYRAHRPAFSQLLKVTQFPERHSAGGRKMKPLFMKSLFSIALLIFAGALAATTFAQEESRSPPPNEQAESQNQMRMERESSEMREMARSMKSMADMCQMMMERADKIRPYLMVALAVVGILFTIAVALFIVLEIQWIRFWNLRIKSEQKHLAKQ